MILYDAMNRTCVAISTTGDPHRLPYLARTVKGWDSNLSDDDSLFITVDGDEEACKRVENVVSHWTGSIYRVGQPAPTLAAPFFHDVRDGRLGVAVNKNTGIELMMDSTPYGTEHLFLSDDDIFPLGPKALDLHVSGNLKHSMVCWGSHRLEGMLGPEAWWSWPRGSMIYTHRSVIEKVGGMVEAFGPGGHEHVEWTRRIYQHGLTPAPYLSPSEYAQPDKRLGRTGMGAADYWDAVDMPLDGEHPGAYAIRKDDITSVRRLPGDWSKIERIMAMMDGSTAFVPYAARENGRASATLYHNPRA